MMIVGQYSGPSGISAVNIGSQATFLLTNMVFGLSVGATVLIGQYLGSGEKDKLKKTVSTLFATLVILGVVLTVAMLFLEVPLLKLIQTPAESFKETQDYYFVTILGLIFIFIYNALSAVMLRYAFYRFGILLLETAIYYKYDSRLGKLLGQL